MIARDCTEARPPLRWGLSVPFPGVPLADHPRLYRQVEALGYPSGPEVPQEDFDHDVRTRVRLLHEWIECLVPLISSVATWAKELDWSVRQVAKPMSDSEIGDYEVPGLILQRDMIKVGLEPVGRSAPGTEGVVDFYVLPAYDDIARLYFYDQRWHLYARASEAMATIRNDQMKPLSKKVFREVLTEMTTHGV